MMMDDKMHAPQIRFSGFSDDWEQRKLGEVSNHRGGTAIEKYFDDNGKYKVISIGSYGLDSRYVDQGIRAHSNEITDKRIVYAGELTMVLNDKTANGTIIGRTLLIENDNEYVVNQRTEIISPKEGFNSRFAYTLLNGPFRHEIKQVVQGGTQIYVNYSSVEKLTLYLPIIEEQKKVGVFFEKLDKLITLHQCKLDKLINIKKSMLEKMFVEKNTDVPEIRFKGFTDTWEQRKLGDLASIGSGRDYKHLSSGNIPVYGTGGYMLSVNEYLSDKDAIGIGRKGTIDKPYILNAPFWTVDTLFFVVPKNQVDLQYLFSVFQKIYWKKYDESTGVPSLSKQSINNITIYSAFYEEQKRIGKFIGKLEDLITLHQRKLEKLKNIKTSCLEKMFV